MAKRMIKCPDCTGEQMTNPKQKETKDQQSIFPFMSGPARDIFNFAADLYNSKSRKKGKKELFDKDCPTCEGKGEIEDKTDRTEQIQSAAKKAEGLKDEILELEASLGPTGGNRHTLVVGDDTLEVGLGYNDSPSYTVIEDGALAQGGVTMEKKAPMKVSKKVNAVVGTNPLATPGGNYTIKCSNKFLVRAGAHGIELSTEGPLKIKAGQTQFIGPEITLGSSQGQVVIEGQHTQINGRSIAITPDTTGSGQVSIGGTMHTTGNIIAQGGAHIEGDMSCISMTMPAKTDRSKHSSQDSQTSQAATWSVDAAEAGLKDFVRSRTIRAQDPANIAISPREIQNISEEQKSLLKKSLPIEEKPTGLIIPGTAIQIQATTCPCNYYGPSTGNIVGVITQPVDLYNFPHHHGQNDGIHAHDTKVPNVNLVDTDEEVRSTGSLKAGPAPVMANISSGGTNLFTKALGLVSKVVATRVNK
jgi:hypothetical protein